MFDSFSNTSSSFVWHMLDWLRWLLEGITSDKIPSIWIPPIDQFMVKSLQEWIPSHLFPFTFYSICFRNEFNNNSVKIPFRIRNLFRINWDWKDQFLDQGIHVCRGMHSVWWDSIWIFEGIHNEGICSLRLILIAFLIFTK